MKNHTSYEMSLFTNSSSAPAYRFPFRRKKCKPRQNFNWNSTLKACIDHTKKTFNFRGQKPINICK